MSLETSSLTSTSSRPLLIQRRADLVIEMQTWHGQEYWVVKDPLALKYYRFEPEEIAILNMLDGKSSAESIVRRFAEKFAPQRITHADLHQFIGGLHRSALLVSDQAGQGIELENRRRETESSSRWGLVSNVLSIRLPGFDPDRLLTGLNAWVGWFFSPLAIVFFLCLGAAALAMVAIEFETFYDKLPTFEQFFASGNWFYLGLTLAITKVLHEFGHGLACKKAGGECHEMGVMFLVFTPCLYCNVSDSWMLPSKYKRAGIGAAGMYVELVLATLCTFGWWFSEPGVFHFLCLNVMFVCSVSTLLFNANPLMRYDGYYILSDLLEIPNLRQKSESILRAKINSWLLGIEAPADPFLPQRHQLLFACYTVAAAVYRWVIALSIFFFIYSILEPYGLKLVGQLFGVATIWGLIGAPIWKTFTFFQLPGRIDQVKKLRATMAGLVFLAAVGGILLAPLPHYVYAPLLIEPYQSESVVVATAGAIRNVHAKAGDMAAIGDVLLTLENPELKREISRLHSRVAELDQTLESLRYRVVNDDFSSKQWHALAKTRNALVEQLQQRESDYADLQVRSTIAGRVAPPVARVQHTDEDGPLPSWSGTPLDQSNVGAILNADTVVCRITEPGRFAATLAIDQSDMEFVSNDQRVEIVLDQLPYEKIVTLLEQIAPVEMKTIPIALSNKGGGPLPTVTNRQGAERPVGAVYNATAAIDDPTNTLLIGGRGVARIHVGSRTIGQRIWRGFCQTFNFDM